MQGTWQGWSGGKLHELQREALPLPAVHEELQQEEHGRASYICNLTTCGVA